MTVILMQLFLVSCIDWKPIPTDEAMTANFKANEVGFCELLDSLMRLHMKTPLFTAILQVTGIYNWSMTAD